MKDITDTVNDVCTTVAMLPNGLQLCPCCPIWKVTVCTGHYYYMSACPVQIRAHHHIDVYTDINNNIISGMLMS